MLIAQKKSANSKPLYIALSLQIKCSKFCRPIVFKLAVCVVLSQVVWLIGSCTYLQILLLKVRSLQWSNLLLDIFPVVGFVNGRILIRNDEWNCIKYGSFNLKGRLFLSENLVKVNRKFLRNWHNSIQDPTQGTFGKRQDRINYRVTTKDRHYQQQPSAM